MSMTPLYFNVRSFTLTYTNIRYYKFSIKIIFLSTVGIYLIRDKRVHMKVMLKFCLPCPNITLNDLLRAYHNEVVKK